MANLKITDLAALTNPVSTDVLPIVDVAGDVTKKVTIADLLQNAGAGSAGSPSFSFDGDSDTGLYRHSANKLTITTAGTERVTVDSNGDLGINTLFPSHKLHVETDTNYAAMFKSSNDATGIIFQDSGSSVGGVAIGSIGDDFVIRRGLTSAELLRVDTAGNVGIDTSSPGVKLVVAGTDAIQVPAGTTAQRPTAAAGQIRLNTTHGYYEGYDGTNWTNLRTLVQTYIASGTQSCDNTSFSTISVIDNNQSLSDSLTTESGGIYTFARAGIYEVYIGITVEGAASNYRWTGQLVATKNGTSTIVGQTKGGYIRDSSGSTETFVNMTFVHEFAASDTVRFRIKRISDTTGTATIQSTTLSTVIIKALKTTD